MTYTTNLDLFHDFATVAEVKSEYRRLAKLHHPDKGGDVEMMKAVNAAYFMRLEALDGQTSTGFDGKDHTYRYEPAVEREAAEMIARLLALDLPGCDVLLIGTWVWVEGNTKACRAEIKTVEGMRWHSKRMMWYWSPDKKRRRYSQMSTEAMKDAYGVKYYASEDSQAVVAA